MNISVPPDQERQSMQRNGSADRRMRVGHITLGLETGGQEKLLLEFARHADRRRYELLFLSLTSRGRLAEELEGVGWPVVALEERPGFRPQISWRIANVLRRWRPHVVHTHDIKPLIYGASGARMAGVPRVVHMRHFGRLPQNSRRQTWLAAAASRLVDSYVCVSKEGTRIALEEGVPADRVRTIWNGIDLERFRFVGPRPDGPAVLVARLSPEKDVATLLKSVAIVVRREPSFQLEIAGAGVCLEELRQSATQLGIDRNVTFLGEVSDIRGLLSRARLFVLSSVTEGISLTLLEAMSVGLPVVATRVGGNPELVIDGETGLLTQAVNPTELARALEEVYSDPQRGRRMGHAGRRRVEQCFNVKRMVTAYEALYASEDLEVSFEASRSTLSEVSGVACHTAGV